MASYIPRWYTHPKTVTHPGTNGARRALTSFMRRTPLTTTPRRRPGCVCVLNRFKQGLNCGGSYRISDPAPLEIHYLQFLYIAVEIRHLFAGIQHSAGQNPSIKHYLNAIKAKQSALNARKPLVGGREPHLCSRSFKLELRPFKHRACKDPPPLVE